MVSGDPPKAERELAADLRLHPQRPPVTRLSRKVLIGLASVAIMAVLGAAMWALDSRRNKQETGSELYNTEHKTTADELAKLPRDYSGLPPGVPPLFVLGPEGGAELVNYRARQNYYVVDRLVAAAELRLGGDHQQKVRIVRTDGRPRW